MAVQPQPYPAEPIPAPFPATRSALQLKLEVSDPEVLAELVKLPEGQPREKYALSALRLGVLALRQASGELDSNAIRDAGRQFISQFGELLNARGSELTAQLTSALRQYFDPSTGALPQRIESLLRNDGELERALRQHVGPENSTLAQAIARQVGEGSPLFKLLSPTDASGVKLQVENMLSKVLLEQKNHILGQFSLDSDTSALSRLVAELKLNNGNLQNDLKAEVNTIVGQFSLDKEDSALSRLVRKVEEAQESITDQFSTDNEASAISRLSKMMQDTRSEIDRNLTLDNENSALARLKRELRETIDGLTTSNNKFQQEVRDTLTVLQTKKQQAAKSTLQGIEFEQQLGNLLADECARLNDFHFSVGSTTGIVKSSKVGDFVTKLGPDSAAPGAQIVWEAKGNKSCNLQQALEEIEIARKNRQSQVGIFVYSRDAAPDDLELFTRYGNDFVVIWDPEDPSTDLHIRLALSIARAYVVRESAESSDAKQALAAIDLATRAIEKQIEHLDQLKTWAETVKTNGDKIADRSSRMRNELSKQVDSLDTQLQALKSSQP